MVDEYGLIVQEKIKAQFFILQLKNQIKNNFIVTLHERLKEIHINKFDSKDVVRHQLVQQIVEAYDVYDEEQMALEEKRKFERIKEQERRQAVANAAAKL